MNQYRNEIRKIMIAVNVMDGAYEIISKKIGIKENMLALLYALDDGKPHSQKEICEEWLIPKTTLNTIVKGCIESGYIVLDTDHRKKEKEIRLTKEGQAYAQAILEQVYELEEESMKQSPQAASPEFVEILQQFTANLKKEARNFANEES